ncbi:MAG: GNAT family N-acetyltransferase [Candidatus Bipolaricaulis sp.]|nr:GNAT family N-acetyltransferase [Candidatus Bipolaricaulis sp.]
MIALRKMTQEEFDAWRPIVEAGYAADHVRAGNWRDTEAPHQARKAFDQLLPNGVNTENHHVCSIVDEATGETVGHLWYFAAPAAGSPSLFVASIGTNEAHRRRGYATAALEALEGEAAALGARSIRLHVFGDNTAARRLYAGLGYRETNVQMVKELAA